MKLVTFIQPHLETELLPWRLFGAATKHLEKYAQVGAARLHQGLIFLAGKHSKETRFTGFEGESLDS